MCEYCPEKFSTKDERLAHTSAHFVTQLCADCNKILIRINGEWYGLHDICLQSGPNDLDFQNDAPFDDAIESFGKVGADEIFNEPPPVQSIKQEIEDDHLSLIYKLQQRLQIIPLSQKLAAKQNAAEQKPFGGRQVSITRTKVEKSTKKPTPKKKTLPKPITKFVNRISSIKPQFTFSNKVWMDHRPAGAVTCDICNKTMRSFNTMKIHMNNFHLGLKKERVSCDECGQTFSSAGNLKSHKRIHLKCKAFVCSYCGKGL